MASPVTLDLSAAKTLFAFGERAAKHGLMVPGDLQQFIDEPEKMARLVEYAKAGAPSYQVVIPILDWCRAYEKLGMRAEYDEFAETNPAGHPGLWNVPVLKGVTPNKVVAAMKKLAVQFYLYANDLDKDVPTNDRDPANGSYVVGFRSNVEADEEFKNLSANQLKAQNHRGITLLERLLLELGYFLATGKHLDEKNVTLCTGSHSSGGHVPRVRWHPGCRRVCVAWYRPVYSYDDLRSRSVQFLSLTQSRQSGT